MISVPIPEIRFSSWDNSELADPIGTRHIVSGSFAYIKQLGLGCDSAMVFDGVKLNAANNEPYASSKVAVVNFCIPNFGDLQSSGVSSVYNFRLWLPSGSGTILNSEGAYIQFSTNSSWTPNLNFPSGAGQALSDTIPDQFNVRRIDGASEITSFNDSNVSEWIYLKIFLDVNFPVGMYGICGSGLIRPRLTFDFY